MWNGIKEFFAFIGEDRFGRNFLRVSFVLLMGCGLISFEMIAGYCSTPTEEIVEVIQGSYSPSTTSTGTGITSNGKAVFTSETTPEQWTVIVKTKDRVFGVTVRDGAEWLHYKTGDHVLMKTYRSPIMGVPVLYRLEKRDAS